MGPLLGFSWYPGPKVWVFLWGGGGGVAVEALGFSGDPRKQPDCGAGLHPSHPQALRGLVKAPQSFLLLARGLWLKLRGCFGELRRCFTSCQV